MYVPNCGGSKATKASKGRTILIGGLAIVQGNFEVVRFTIILRMVKVLISGGVCGRLGWLEKRVSVLNDSNHGPFDMVLCVGEFFPEDCSEFVGKHGNDGNVKQLESAGEGCQIVAGSHRVEDEIGGSVSVAVEVTEEHTPNEVDYLDFLTGGCKKFPIPLYFVTGRNVASCLNDDGVDAATGKSIGYNLTWLGRCGVTVLQGLKIVYLSSNTIQKKGQGEHEKAFSPSGPGISDVIDRLNSEKETDVDILLTSEWPTGIANGSQNSLNICSLDLSCCSDDAQTLCRAACPRYHFGGCVDKFFQRSPFETAVESKYTRFIGLANVRAESSDKSVKWLHALVLNPCSEGNFGPPPISFTPNPFSLKNHSDIGSESIIKAKSKPALASMTKADVERIIASEETSTPQHFWSLDEEHRDPKNNTSRKRARKYNVAPRGNCWYCLASPSIETHLIVSIFEDVYLSMPKGALSAQHCQIIPVSHEPTLVSLDSLALAQVVRYKNALVEYYASFGCVPLFFERNISLAKAMQHHAFLEVIPLPRSALKQFLEVFESHSKRFGLHFEILDLTRKNSIPESSSATNDEDGIFALKTLAGDDAKNLKEYFYIEVPRNGISPRVCFFEPNVPNKHKMIPLYFGRGIACELLGCPDRVNWKGCIVPTEVETRMAADFKEGWRPFDFTS